MSYNVKQFVYHTYIEKIHIYNIINKNNINESKVKVISELKVALKINKIFQFLKKISAVLIKFNHRTFHSFLYEFLVKFHVSL